jgi:hypothetical protein
MRITPSNFSRVALSEKAIPFYYAQLNDPTNDDLVLNWSYDKTVSQQLSQVYSYIYTADNQHPLLDRLVYQDFLRVEGLIGKPLGQALRSLQAERKRLGLAFAISPVYFGFNLPGENDPRLLELDNLARQEAGQALRRWFECHLDDINLFYKVQMGSLYYYLHTLVNTISKMNTIRLIGTGGAGRVPPVTPPVSPPVIARPSLRLDVKLDRLAAETSFTELQKGVYKKGSLTAKLASSRDPKESFGSLYISTKPGASSVSLFDRFSDIARGFDPAIDPDLIKNRLYPLISLLDRTEELVQVVSASSVTDFNFEQFEARYQAYIEAFDNYQEFFAKQKSEPGSELDALNDQLQPIYLATASASSRAVFGRMSAELRQRAQEVFRGSFLENFTKVHPGLDHQGGVPAGGTLVLLYTSTTGLSQVFERYQKSFAGLVIDIRSKIGIDPGTGNVDFTKDMLDENARQKQPLDKFTILADFYLPYHCCDECRLD